VAISRLKYANPVPLVSLKHHPYQIAFMQARRLRVCPQGHQWSILDGKLCPHCAVDRLAAKQRHDEPLIALTDGPPTPPQVPEGEPLIALPGTRAFRYFYLRAGRRGGKTRIGALSVIEELATNPGSWWWCCAPTFPELEDFVMPVFFSQLPQAWVDHPDTEWSETNRTLRLPNGSVAQFRSLEDPDRSRGPGLDGLWIDEVCKLTQKHWETARPMLSDRLGIFIGTTTPKGEDWANERFFEPAEQGIPGYWACEYESVDNPGFPAEEQEEARRMMTPEMFDQEYRAKIVNFTGAIYGDMVLKGEIEGTDEEMRTYFPNWPHLDPSYASITGLDPGTDHPFAGVHLVASPLGLVAVGEYEARSRPFMLHAQHIQAMRRGMASRVGIDRSQAQAQIELAQHGVFTVPAENDVIAGIQRVSAWLLANHKPQGTMLPRGGLILPRRLVPLLLRRLKSYRWAENERKDGSAKREMVYKKFDDLPDALRYALMTWPHLPKIHPEGGLPHRDLSTLPDITQQEIERMRRVDKAGAADPGTVVGSGLFDDGGDDQGPPVQGMGDFNM
jgi:hypothetical protein